MKKSNFKAEEALVVSEAILPGVDRLFQHQRGASKHSKDERTKKKANRSSQSSGSLKFTSEKHDIFDSRIKDELNPDKSKLDDLLKSYLSSNASEWCWLLSCNFNLLLFGVGSKRNLVERFITHHLSGEDVLEVEASMHAHSSQNERVVRDLLDTISHSILGCKDFASNLLSVAVYAQAVAGQVIHLLNRHYDRPSEQLFGRAVVIGSEEPAVPSKRRRESVSSAASSTSHNVKPEWGGRYAHAQCRLYIVIHDIGAISSPLSQESLSMLAACPSVSIIATADHLNAPLLWTANQLARFHWTYAHCPTYEICDLVHKKSPFVVDKSVLAEDSENSAVDHVLASVTAKHKEIFAMLCGLIVTVGSEASQPRKSQGKGAASSAADRNSVSIAELASKCKNKMLCRNKNDLLTTLNEFVDHKLMTVHIKEDYLELHLSPEQIRRYGDVHS